MLAHYSIHKRVCVRRISSGSSRVVRLLLQWGEAGARHAQTARVHLRDVRILERVSAGYGWPEQFLL